MNPCPPKGYDPAVDDMIHQQSRASQYADEVKTILETASLKPDKEGWIQIRNKPLPEDFTKDSVAWKILDLKLGNEWEIDILVGLGPDDFLKVRSRVL